MMCKEDELRLNQYVCPYGLSAFNLSEMLTLGNRVLFMAKDQRMTVFFVTMLHLPENTSFLKKNPSSTWNLLSLMTVSL